MHHTGCKLNLQPAITLWSNLNYRVGGFFQLPQVMSTWTSFVVADGPLGIKSISSSRVANTLFLLSADQVEWSGALAAEELDLPIYLSIWISWKPSRTVLSGRYTMTRNIFSRVDDPLMVGWWPEPIGVKIDQLILSQHTGKQSHSLSIDRHGQIDINETRSRHSLRTLEGSCPAPNFPSTWESRCFGHSLETDSPWYAPSGAEGVLCPVIITVQIRPMTIQWWRSYKSIDG